jgi:putative transposase
VPRPRRFFPPEYKAEVVELIRSTGKTVGQVARELNLTETAVRQWVRHADLDAGHRHDGLTTAEREELRRCAARTGSCARSARSCGRPRFSSPGDRSPVRCYRLIDQEKAHHPVSRLARVLGVARAGYYAWARRPLSQRAVADQALTEQIRRIHARSRATYGAPRVHAELRLGLDVQVGRKRVARLLGAAGLQGCHRRRRRGLTRRDPQAAPAPDLVQRNFTPPAPDRLWVADITQQRTGDGWLYLAVVLDAFSRRIVGWSMAEHLRTELVLAGLSWLADEA